MITYLFSELNKTESDLSKMYDVPIMLVAKV